MKIIHNLMLAIFLLPMIAPAQSWVQQTSGTTQILASVFMINESEGWICGDAGVLLHTTNGGVNWVQVNVTGNDLQDIAFRDAQTGILVGDDGLIFRTTNGGLNWSPVISGTGANLAAVSWATNNTVFVSGRDGAALLSTNEGASWSVLNTGAFIRYRGGNAMNNKLWAVGEDGIIRHSADNGATWQGQLNPATNDLHDIQFLNENTGYAGGSNSTVLFTSNSGANWTSRSTGINFGINGIFFLNETTGWAASDGGIIYHTSNSGLNWIVQNTSVPAIINEVYFPTAAKGWAVGENGTIFYLDNGVPVELKSFTGQVTGQSVTLTWSTASETNNSGFEIQKKLSAFNEWSTAGFVQGQGTAANGRTYSFSETLETGSYNYRLKQINYDGSFEYYILNNEIVVSVLDEYSLDQNYPNPFNPSTEISFTLPESGQVSLKIYNILGTEVASIVNGYRNQGKHSVVFNANNLSSGIYLYKLEAGNFTQVRKMSLLK